MIASGSWGLAVFPLGAAVVATVFAWRLGARFARRRRAVEGHWTVALAMFAVASAAMFLGVARGWTAAEFRLYWLFGAVLNVPYLFLGELQLLIRRRSLRRSMRSNLSSQDKPSLKCPPVVRRNDER